MIGLFFPCFFIFAALFGGRASAFVVDYPDFLKTDLPGFAKILCNSVESYLNISSIGQDPVLARLGQDISRIGICRPGHTIFFFQRVSDQDIQKLLLIRDQVQQRVSEIQQINLLVALIVISCVALLALVFFSRAGKRFTQAVCLLYFDLMLALGFIWKFDYEDFATITDASWGLAQEVIYHSKDLILSVFDWACFHIGNPEPLDWLFFYIAVLISLFVFCHAVINLFYQGKTASLESGVDCSCSDDKGNEHENHFFYGAVFGKFNAWSILAIEGIEILKMQMLWIYRWYDSMTALIASFQKGRVEKRSAAEEELFRQNFSSIVPKAVGQQPSEYLHREMQKWVDEISNQLKI
jgi:hypothetical protein